MNKIAVSQPPKKTTLRKHFTAALLGNPNCGKTMLFNVLTGSNQYVGNWPGVTVEKKIGRLQSNLEGELVDLPGIYSLSTYSIEERVSRDFILNENPDVIINIIDGSNIERNLYLTLQALEIGRPMIIVINMMDEVKKRGDTIFCDKLSGILGVPVIPISAKKGENIALVLKEVEQAAYAKPIPPKILYDQSTYDVISRITQILVEEENHHNIPFRFYATKLLEGDSACITLLGLSSDQCFRINQIIEEYERKGAFGDRETMLSDARFCFIEQVVAKSVKRKYRQGEMTLSDRIDRIVTNRWLAYPVFFTILFLMFMLTFQTVGAFLQEELQALFDNVLSPLLTSFLLSVNAPDWTQGLLVDGILNGVGTVVSFVPLIALLFFCLSIMEDSGYMARAAFIMDKLFSKFGLSGQSFIPMIMGFGCSVPAIMSARTMPSEKDRRLTILLTPFMSCGAKLPVYGLFAAAFFPEYQGYVIFGMYLIGMVVAVLSGLLLSRVTFRGDTMPFVMELPPYRLPSLRGTCRLTWDKAKDFLVRAGTIIFAMSIVLWFLQAFNFHFQMVTDNSQSMLALIGACIAPVFIPLGFGTWQATVSVLSGFVAKEAVVSTMAVLYAGQAGGSNALVAGVQAAFTPASAFAMMVFVLLCAPCMAACATIKREMNSWKWALFTYAYQIGVAYIISFLVYRVCLLLL